MSWRQIGALANFGFPGAIAMAIAQRQIGDRAFYHIQLDNIQ
jgi:hypothetical protein